MIVARDRFIAALDVPNAAVALPLPSAVSDHIGMFDIGPEQFVAEGSAVVTTPGKCHRGTEDRPRSEAPRRPEHDARGDPLGAEDGRDHPPVLATRNTARSHPPAHHRCVRPEPNSRSRHPRRCTDCARRCTTTPLRLDSCAPRPTLSCLQTVGSKSRHFDRVPSVPHRHRTRQRLHRYPHNYVNRRVVLPTPSSNG